MNVRRFLPDLAVVAVIIAAALFVSLSWARPGALYYGDGANPPVDPGTFFLKHLFVWNASASLGGGLDSGVRLAPYALILSALAAVAGNSSAQMLAAGLALAIGAGAAYAALRIFGADMPAAIAGTCVYAVNPWAAAIFPANVPAAWCFAIGPVAVAVAGVAAREPARRDRMRVSFMLLAALPLAVVASDSGATIAFAVFCALGFYAAFLRAADRATFLRWLFVTAGAMLVAALWWLVPVFLTFARNAAAPSPLAQLLLLAGAVVAAGVTTVLARLAPRQPVARIVLAAAVIGASAFWGRSLFATSAMRDESGLLTASSYVSIPAYWYDAAGWLNAQSGEGAALVVPAGTNYQGNYDWGTTGSDDLATELFRRQTIVLRKPAALYTTSEPDYTAHAFGFIDDAMTNPSENLSAALRLLGIRFVIYRGDVVQPLGFGRLTIVTLQQRLPGRRIVRFGPLAAIDLGPPPAALTSGGVWIAGSYAAMPLEARFHLATLLEDVPRIDVAEISRTVPSKPAAYEVEARAWNQRFAGGVEAADAITHANVRYVWSVPTNKLLPVNDNTAPVRLAADVAPIASTRTVISVPSKLLPVPPAASSAGSIATLVLALPDGPDGGKVALVNPSSETMTGTVEIAVAVSEPTTFSLNDDGRTVTDRIDRSAGSVWAAFPGVTLQPGTTRFTVTRSGAASGRRASTANASLGAVRVVNTSFAPVNSNDPKVAHHNVFARLRLNVPLTAAAIVGVDAPALPPNGELGGIVDFRVKGARARCWAPFAPYAQIDVETTAIACLDAAGRSSAIDDVSRADVDSVDLDFVSDPGAPRPAGNFGVESVSASWAEGGQDARPLSGVTILSDARVLAGNGNGAVHYVKNPRTVTAVFDPSGIAARDTIRFTAGGATVASATLGHLTAAGGFAGDGDLTKSFVLHGNSLGIRPEDLRAKKAAYRFTIAANPQTSQYVGVSATVSEPNAARLTVRTPARMPAVIDVDDRTGATSAASIGAGAFRPDSVSEPSDGLPLVVTAPAKDSYVRLRQAYSPWWLGLCVWQCHAAHYEDALGWNTWLVTGAGTVAIANGAVLLQLLAALASFVSIAYCSLRAVRVRP